MQQRTYHILNATSTSWRSVKDIQRALESRKIRGYLRGNVLIELLGLTELGLVEMRKEVVLGENGGELTYKFRRKVWQGAAV